MDTLLGAGWPASFGATGKGQTKRLQILASMQASKGSAKGEGMSPSCHVVFE
jgi:hypothetical protein